VLTPNDGGDCRGHKGSAGRPMAIKMVVGANMICIGMMVVAVKTAWRIRVRK